MASISWNPLAYARAQMGTSLAFHIVFAAVGVALPAFMVIADLLHRRTGDPDYLHLSKRLAKGTSILFAVGAVSGTVLSFELGLLWPRFMGTFGEAIGLPFALEGIAFFTEAIFLGIYLYGRGRVSPNVHLATGIGVALSGAASAFFVTLVNAFMNGPRPPGPDGFDPVVAMWSPSWPYQTVHVLISCYQATAWAMVGIHALFLLRDPARRGRSSSARPSPSPGPPRRSSCVGWLREVRNPPAGSEVDRSLHRKALALALPVACVTALLQPLSGDRSAKHLAEAQPLKLAAAEAHLHTGPRAALHIGGIPDLATGEFQGAIAVPGGLSFLAFGDLDATVTGLEAFPRAEWPPVMAVRTAFQVMVGAGTAMAALGFTMLVWRWRRRRWPDNRLWLRMMTLAGPLGFVSLEAGWLVTEWGRQPWVVHGALRTADAVTDFPYKAAPFWLFTVVYLLLGVAVAFLLWRQLLVADAPAMDRAPGQEASHDH